MLFDETQKDDRDCQRILRGTMYRKQCTHCLRPFALLITGECVLQSITFNELSELSGISFSILGSIQLQHRAAPAYTDTRSRLHRFGIQILSQIESVVPRSTASWCPQIASLSSFLRSFPKHGLPYGVLTSYLCR